jgi:uncharacterized damage-inducible protein DinB
MIRLETVLDSWKTVREDTALAVEDFPASELDFKATPELMTFREIARHVLEASHAITGLMLSGEENLARPEFRQMLRPHMPHLPDQPDAATLAAALRQCFAERATQMAAAPAGFWDAEITRFDGIRVTRLEMLQFIKEHELTHRAQLFLYLRLKNIVPPTTRRRQAKQAGR